MSKIDPYKHKESYFKWKKEIHSRIPKINQFNSDLIKQYLQDMENGLNVATTNKRGSRSYSRLNTLRRRMVFMAKMFEERFKLEKMVEIKEENLFQFFVDMRNGTISKCKDKGGGAFKSAGDYVKDFKAFWHWWMKVNRKKGITISDITLDLDTSKEKPRWVYLTEKQIKKMCLDIKFDYKVLIWFLFDTGIRAPTELMNVRVSDFFNDFKELQIREEVSKTFGRRIKLMICSELIKEYVNLNELKADDYLFTKKPENVNNYLKRLTKRIFGDEKSPAGELYKNLSMYDLRHCSCCYWLPRYKSESALKYRFGWKKSDKIHYYSELLGMRDTITEEDLLTDITKVELEKRIDKTEKENELLKEDNAQMKISLDKVNRQLKEIYAYVNQLTNKIVVVQDGRC